MLTFQYDGVSWHLLASIFYPNVDEFVAAESLKIQSGTPSLNKHAVIV
jgi:hypothetical protein